MTPAGGGACRERTLRFQAAVTPLPGRVPNDNHRRMSVAARFEGLRLDEFLVRQHPHIELEFWRQRAADGLLSIDGRRVVSLDRVMRAGNRLVHTIPGEVEPDVAVDVRFLYEDESLIVLCKPAPLPMHPCGRFNRNSLVPLLQHAFGETFWLVHRLDADTTGLVVLARTKEAARRLSQQFERREVEKLYLVRVRGEPSPRDFVCDLPLEAGPGESGKRRAAASEALPASTTFRWVRSESGTSVLTAAPSSGRTNQIRAHLAALGHPIVGDSSYGTTQAFTSAREPLCLHAFRLGLAHPDTGRQVRFEAEAPQWAAASWHAPP